MSVVEHANPQRYNIRLHGDLTMEITLAHLSLSLSLYYGDPLMGWDDRWRWGRAYWPAATFQIDNRSIPFEPLVSDASVICAWTYMYIKMRIYVCDSILYICVVLASTFILIRKQKKTGLISCRPTILKFNSIWCVSCLLSWLLLPSVLV